MLSLLDAATPSGLEPWQLDQYVTHVVLAGTATVWVDGCGITIPEGRHYWVRSTSMRYSTTPPDEQEEWQLSVDS